jgi:hypothetical protein
MRMSVSKKTLALLAALLAIGLSATVAGAQDIWGFTGWKTKQPAMIAPVKNGVVVEPLLTVGERLRNGYMFESIPDGIAYKITGDRTVDVYVNHETSTVPFPFDPATGVGLNDFTNAMLSKLTLHRRSGSVQTGSLVIPSEANYQRFCSNFMAGAEHGFDREIIFTNEEATDFVNRTGEAWPARPGAEQAGVVAAYDVASGEYKTIYGMGRHNHENSVAIPGYGHPVVLTGDDTFSPPSSQLYLYTATSRAQLWADQGTLYAFKSSNPLINDYGDLSGNMSVSGTFIPVPEAIAKGDQTGLESWSNANNVFQFIRIEDTAYDRTNPNIQYLADTGEPRALPGTPTGRLVRGPAGSRGPYPNGRLFKMVLDPANPLNVLSLSILVDADAGGYNNVNVIHQLDNLETTVNSVFIQEDPGSHNQGQTTARIWRYDISDGTTEVIARVDQSQQPLTPLGAWESSGIIDASAAFGPDWFLVDVQAPTLVIQREQRGNLTYEREGGQLLLLKIPGG